MVTWQQERTGGRLVPYLAYAAVIHAALFVMSSFHSAHASAEAEMAPTADRAASVDVEQAIPEPPATLSGGGSPIAGAPAVATARPLLPTARRKAMAAAPDRVAVVEPPRGDRVSSPVPEVPSDLPAHSDEDAPSVMAAMQASDDRRQREMAVAAAAAGVGRGGSGGPGGSGAGWGAPAIHGKIAFGNGSRGALTGRVCFLPVGTLRIADVRTCDYVATFFTDTLDIPERQFTDGFPGVTNRSDWFLIDYTGTFAVTGYGTYVFRLHSDDGSYLFVDDTLVIDNDGKHAPESRSGRVQLAVGEHRIRVRYAQTTDRMALQLFVRTPQSSRETIFTTQL